MDGVRESFATPGGGGAHKPHRLEVVGEAALVGNHGRGISMHDNGGAAVSDARVVHNTIMRNGSTGLLHNVNAGTGNVIANDLFADNGWIYGYKQIRVQSGSSNVVSKNIVWSPDVAPRGIEEPGGSSNTVSGNLSEDPPPRFCLR